MVTVFVFNDAVVLAVLVTTSVPGYKQVHSLEIALGLLEQYVAHDGKSALAVTLDSVKVAQNADAVASLADRYEAQGSESGSVQAKTTGNKARN